MEGLSIKLPDELRRRLALEAKRRNLTQSAVVRECIERVLADTPGARQPETCADLVGDLTGSVRSGRSDLATNKAVLDDAMLGRKSRVTKRRR